MICSSLRTMKRDINHLLLSHFILIQRRIMPRPVERLPRVDDVGMDVAPDARLADVPPIGREVDGDGAGDVVTLLVVDATIHEAPSRCAYNEHTEQRRRPNQSVGSLRK